jgi:hypothetical protein
MIYKKKLQVFVSSTYIDLIEERQAAVEAILTAGHIPAGMELFAAGNESQLNVIKRWIDESDVYLLILGGRYGSVEPTSGKSYTQLEYEYAVATNKPLFAVVADEGYLDERLKTMGRKIIEIDNSKPFKEFKAEVLNRMVKFYKDTKDIKLAILETMSEFNRREDLKGWVPGNQGLDTGIMAEEIARLTKENFDLRKRVNEKAIGSEPTYNSLTFYQLEELLKKTKLGDGLTQTNLFEFLISHAEELVRGLRMTKSSVEAKTYLKLVEFKVVKFDYDSTYARYTFYFTEDGHKFYLMALIRETTEKIS